MSQPNPEVNPEEMKMYGLSPDDPRDMALWADTTPIDADRPADYSQDSFEFGGLPRQTEQNVVESDMQTNRGD